MGGLTSAVHWWEDWQLRVLVLSSLAIQCLLLLLSLLRRNAIPGLVRFMMWLAYLAGDAVAIYALATLFNRHKTDEHGGSTLEVVWAPVLLLHLGGHDGFTAYNIEDNELWSRHLVTAVSQVTVAIYVFCKSWPPGGDERLLQAAILLFVPGVFKCFVKPWALKSASIYSLVSSSPAAASSLKQNEDEIEDYVEEAKRFVSGRNAQGEAAQVAVDGQDNEVPGGVAIGTLIREVMEHVRKTWVELVDELVEAWVKAEETSQVSCSLFGGFRERMRERVQRHRARQDSSNNRVREMLQGRSEACKLFVDLSSSYSHRLSILQDFWGLREATAYGRVRQALATAFLLLYTKLKTVVGIANAEFEDYQERGLKYHLRIWIPMSRLVLTWAAIGLFHHCHREAYNHIDVKITYAIFCSTAVLETYSSFSLFVRGEAGEKWPEMVSQYSFIGYFARNIKHSKMMWIVSLLGCKDFLDQHWCMKSCFSSATISKLVLGYLKDGWKEKIHDATSYRRFNDHRTSSSSGTNRNRDRPSLFDESLLLWHIATEFCFFSSSLSKHSKECAFAKVPKCTERLSVETLPLPATRSLQGKLNLIIYGIIQRIREMVLKCSSCQNNRNGCWLNPKAIMQKLCRISSTGKHDPSTSRCDHEFTCCKAVLCRQMSNYMAYLLFVNPEMLLPGSRRNLFTSANEELQDLFKSDSQASLPLDNKTELTEKIKNKLNLSSKAGTISATFIHEAWMLARKLQSPRDEKKMWEEIQDVWVEMLCYSASRCRGYLHAKALGNGGEFLSYVWLLLFHMGMETFTDKLQRQEPPSHEARRSNDTAEQTGEVSTTTSMDRLQREHLPTPSQGASQYGTASTSEICQVADDVV